MKQKFPGWEIENWFLNFFNLRVLVLRKNPCLSKGKVLVPPPGSSFFRIDKMHKQRPFNFDVSGQKIYLYYGVMNEKNKNKTVSIDDVMNVKNLKAVIPMLKKHPAAHKIAKFDLSSFPD